MVLPKGGRVGRCQPLKRLVSNEARRFFYAICSRFY